jgi:hypothetical protein
MHDRESLPQSPKFGLTAARRHSARSLDNRRTAPRVQRSFRSKSQTPAIKSRARSDDRQSGVPLTWHERGWCFWRDRSSFGRILRRGKHVWKPRLRARQVSQRAKHDTEFPKPPNTTWTQIAAFGSDTGGAYAHQHFANSGSWPCEFVNHNHGRRLVAISRKTRPPVAAFRLC